MKQTILLFALGAMSLQAGDLQKEFATPPDSSRPGVYWYFMDGNLSRVGMTRDLESMKAAGLGHALFLEVNVGVKRGPVNFLSDEWQNLYAHAVHEAERLGMEIILGSGPGWTGSGGPWVKPEQSMQHLVASKTECQGPGPFAQKLPVPPPRRPFFGDVPGQLKKAWEGFYKDVAVLAFRTPSVTFTLPDVDEKALYYRAPFSSQKGVKPYLEALAAYPPAPEGSAVSPDQILDLTSKLKPDGSLDWQVPEGKWTVMRFVSRNNGMSTRPSPEPGIGFECDKWNTNAFDSHFDNYVGKLLSRVGPRQPGRGWTMLHIDSWEMGAQNWTPAFRAEFQKRCGYDPQPFYPVYLGQIVGSREQSERFLWDLRQVGSELNIEHHVERLKALGRQHGFTLSIEPYDMHPGNDFDMGSVADVPMSEFWSLGFNTAFSCLQASSIAHVMGRPVVAAEAFTGEPGENWRFYPGYLKNQGGWAFCAGINRFTYHTFAHKPDETKPGMVMGPYGVHWDRGQTWWPMVAAYHRYISRCQHMLRQGRTVADILYLIPEGAPNIFQPPATAVEGVANMPDRRSYNFDGCSANRLIELAGVRDGRIVFPGGASYALLVLPDCQTMTPALISKLDQLLQNGANIMGSAPVKSPSLIHQPEADRDVAAKAASIWGPANSPDKLTAKPHGKGTIIPAGSNASQASIMNSHWIWYPEGDPARMYPVAPAFFRRDIPLDPNRVPVSAQLQVTADNTFEVVANGIPIGKGDSFHEIYSFNLAPALTNKEIKLAIRADNIQEPGPAGLIASVLIRYSDGSEQAINTDDKWMSSKEETANWKPAKILGPATMSPWRLQSKPQLYPSYDLAVQYLSSRKTAPDFTAAGPVRYTHRTTADQEIYFVANRSDKPIHSLCTFRISGRSPELWNPVTGQIRSLPDFSTTNSLTAIPLDFDAYESYFIVFPQKSNSDAPASPANFPRFKTATTIDGAWDVHFDTAMGGPGTVRFDKLEDWTKRTEPGITYYSGIATYTKKFDLPQSGATTTGFLDLGQVNVMARVKVNGQDCGVAWTAPWRVDISKAIKPTGNTLEIEVANLWPNRMIGDLKNPGKSYSQTTFHPFKPTSPLLPSGLIGPVTIQIPVKE